ncbi:MAG: T9SS type A sorting domain-containing protein [Bacteroidales bacterium]|nr:T9SS type A sorting domain-containing protein [Bacteroidales bacterium]
MITKKLELFILFLLFSGLTRLHAQEAILSAGGEASGSGGSASYSVGQIVYTTNKSINSSVAQGVQHPYEIYLVSEIELYKRGNIVALIYPNPADDFLILKIQGFEQESLSYELYDINGQLLDNKRIITDEMIIALDKLIPSTYYFKVIEGNTEIKTFKIVKK